MKQNKQKTNTGYKLLIILMLVIIAVSAFLGLYAWSKYTSNKPGDAAAQVAKWSFKMRAGQTETSPKTPFAMTRTDGYGDVATDKLAPGTFGSIPVYIDMTGTEVLTKLDLTFTVTDCPRNIKFYSDENRTEELEFTQTTDGGKYISTVEITKYYDVATVSDVHNETIYWGWAYETKDDGNSSTVGDQRDKEDSNNDAKLVITATATEVLNDGSAPLAQKVQVGDKVNYNPGSYSIDTAGINLDGVSIPDGTISTAKDTPIQVASTNDVKLASISSNTEWQVLNVNIETGVVELIPVNAETGKVETTDKKVQLYGKNGYINTIKGLDKVATIYGHGYGATGARSITVEDINKIENYTPTDSSLTYTLYNGTYLEEDVNGNITEKKANCQVFDIDDYVGTAVTISYRANTPEKSTNTCYSYSISSSLFKDVEFFLASRSMGFNTGYRIAYFNVRYVKNGSIDSGSSIFWSNNTEFGQTHTIVPVVTLKSDVKTSGQVKGVWQLK